MLIYNIILLLFNYLFATHVRSEGNGNIDGAVSVEVVFQERYQHSRRRDNGVVEGVRKVFTFFAVDSDFESARLSVTEVGAGADFKILLLTRRPRFNVKRTNL